MALFSPRLSAKEMALICRQLATTYSAGIPILKALSLTAGQGPSSKGRRALLSMEALIRQGSTLSQAALAQSNVFPEFFVEMLAAGETGGRLDVLLRDLADHYEATHRMRQAVIVSMLYPGMQLVSAWFLGTFALGILKASGNLYGGGRFSMSSYLSGYLWFQAGAIAFFLLALALLALLSRKGVLQGPLSWVKNHVWPLNKVSQKFALARFFRAMSLLINAGIDIRQCVERAAAITMNPAIERDLLSAIPVIVNGGTLVEAFSRCRYMTRIGREMISVGEQSGNLDASLRKAGEYSFQEAQTAVQAAAKILQVAVILAVGGFVAYFVITFYSNLYGPALQGL